MSNEDDKIIDQELKKIMESMKVIYCKYMEIYKKRGYGFEMYAKLGSIINLTLKDIEEIKKLKNYTLKQFDDMEMTNKDSKIIDWEIIRIFELMKNRVKNFSKIVGINNSNNIKDMDDELKILKVAVLHLLYPIEYE